MHHTMVHLRILMQKALCRLITRHHDVDQQTWIKVTISKAFEKFKTHPLTKHLFPHKRANHEALKKPNRTPLTTIIC